jgi:Inositol hexakisphosphate
VSLVKNRVIFPIIIIDLRQESHGFFELTQPLQGESTIAVGWFAERDWMSIGKNLVSINADEDGRFHSVDKNPNLSVIEIKSVTEEGGVCTGMAWPVSVVTSITENGLALQVGCQYQRFPATDHVRPQDIEIDQFIAFEAGLQGKSVWLHFHCRGGDGRTTTFLAMHDMIHNAPSVAVEDILNRQQWLGGVDLNMPPDTGKGTKSFKYPFAVERAQFMQIFYKYVCDAKPGNFAVSWSTWLVQNNIKF